MNKELLLKSVIIGFDDAGKATVQLQHLERLSYEGEVIKETYLPHERFSLALASVDQKKQLKAVLGAAVASQLADLHQAQAHLELAEVEHNRLTSALGTAVQGANDARRQLAEAEIEHGRLTGALDTAAQEAETMRQQLEVVQSSPELSAE